jgi:hypothetical protein
LAHTFLEARRDPASSSSSSSSRRRRLDVDGRGEDEASGGPAANPNAPLRLQYVLRVPATRRVVAETALVVDSEPGRSGEASTGAAACYEAARGTLSGATSALAVGERAAPHAQVDFGSGSGSGFGFGSGYGGGGFGENHFEGDDSPGANKRLSRVCGRSPSPPVTVADESKVALLAAMGFPEDLARATLLEHLNDAEAAAEALLGFS